MSDFDEYDELNALISYGDMEPNPDPQERIEPESTPTSGQERELLNSPEPTERTETNRRKRKRLSGARRKKLSRLLKTGVDYNTALKLTLEGVDERKRKPEGSRSPTDEFIRKDLCIPLKQYMPQNYTETKTEYPRGTNSTHRATVKGIKAGIIHLNHPKTELTNQQLQKLQCSILKAVNDIPDDGPQVRFKGCTIRPGWIQITCADENTLHWLDHITKQLQPWENAKLKFVRSHELPKPNIFTAYIPDDEVGKRLSSDVVLTRLKKMNRDLNTVEWAVLHREQSGRGQIWTFAIDNLSMYSLERQEFKPYFGFGQVHFRKKSRVGKESHHKSRVMRKRSPERATSPLLRTQYCTLDNYSTVRERSDQTEKQNIRESAVLMDRDISFSYFPTALFEYPLRSSSIKDSRGNYGERTNHVTLASYKLGKSVQEWETDCTRFREPLTCTDSGSTSDRDSPFRRW